MGKIVLGFTILFALATSSYGLYTILHIENADFSAKLHNSIWFVFACLSNVSGIASIFLETWNDRHRVEEVEDLGSGFRRLLTLEYHFFFAWLTVLPGYACIVTQSWMNYYPVQLSHVHIALVCIPILAWLKKKKKLIIVSTQLVSGISVLSHLYISQMARDWWAFVGALIMALQIIAMSLPGRFTFFSDSFTTREASLLFSGICSYAFSKGVVGYFSSCSAPPTIRESSFSGL